MTERSIERLERQHRDIFPCPKPPKRRGKSPQHPKMRRSRLKCGGPMKQYNAKRKGHAFPKNVDEARRDFIRAQACVVTGRATGEWIQWESWMPKLWKQMSPWKCHVVVAHVKPRRLGGLDKNNIVPLDSRIHDWQGVLGWPAFEKRLQLKPAKEMAAYYERRYQLEAA